MKLKFIYLGLVLSTLVCFPKTCVADYLVADWGYGSVLRYSDSGEFLGDFISGVNPVSLAVDGNGSVFVADGLGRCIHRYTDSGVYLNTLNCKISNLRKIVFDKNLQCLYATRWDGGEIYKITLDGTVTLLVNSDIPRIGQIAVSSDGRIYAPDPNRSLIRVFDVDGQDQGVFLKNNTWYAVCDSTHKVHITGHDCRILAFDPGARHVTTSDRLTSSVWALAVTSQDDILSLESHRRIRRFSNSGIWREDIQIPEAWFAWDVAFLE